MAKIKTKKGFRFVKELGGAIRHGQASFAAQWLIDNELIRGRVLDYGCGHGFDAEHFGWTGYDPSYRPQPPQGCFDTIVCNHVLNMLTRKTRQSVLASIGDLLNDTGIAWLIVPRNIPARGKVGLRNRIQNYVVLDLPSVLASGKLEIYRMSQSDEIRDNTKEIEVWLSHQ